MVPRRWHCKWTSNDVLTFIFLKQGCFPSVSSTFKRHEGEHSKLLVLYLYLSCWGYRKQAWLFKMRNLKTPLYSMQVSPDLGGVSHLWAKWVGNFYLYIITSYFSTTNWNKIKVSKIDDGYLSRIWTEFPTDDQICFPPHPCHPFMLAFWSFQKILTKQIKLNKFNH